MRLLIYVTPSKAWWWPSRDFSAQPTEVKLVG
jgi:hypothetical protein